MSDLIYGRHPVIEAIAAGTSFDKVWIQQDVRGDFEKELRALCKINEVPLQTVPKERLQFEVKGNHQGVIGWLSSVTYYKLADVLPGIYEQGGNPLFVLLDRITDVRNIGAIARTAEGMGAHALVVSAKSAAPLNADAMKTSAGALNYLKVCREKSMMGAVEFLQLNGIPVFAADLGGSAWLYELDFTGPSALLMGSEGEGISPSLLEKTNTQFKIPIVGQVESYNVSVSAGMVLYEVQRQRKE